MPCFVATEDDDPGHARHGMIRLYPVRDLYVVPVAPLSALLLLPRDPVGTLARHPECQQEEPRAWPSARMVHKNLVVSCMTSCLATHIDARLMDDQGQ